MQPDRVTKRIKVKALQLLEQFIICPARALPRRVPPDWKKPLTAGRLLILSAFTATANRISAALAARRNEFVAALADEVFIAHATAGGHLEKLIPRLRAWRIPGLSPQPQPTPQG